MSADATKIMDLVDLARAAGDEPAVERDDETIGYRFARAMPDSVREAGYCGEWADYHRSVDSDPPTEGFVDSAGRIWLFFPLDPAHDLLGSLATAHGGTRRRGGLLYPAMLGGGAVMLLFALLLDGGDRVWLLGAAAVWFVAACGVRRWM